MNKILLLLTIVAMAPLIGVCETSHVTPDFHKWNNGKNNTSKERTPMRLPIEVYYDDETSSVSIEGNGIEASVYVYGSTGALVLTFPVCDVEFTLPSKGAYAIQIVGDNWYAECQVGE